MPRPIRIRPEIKNLNWKGNPIKQLTYKGTFSKDDVQEIADNVRQHLKKGERLMVTLNYGDGIGAKSSKWATNKSHSVALYSAGDYNPEKEDPEEFDHVHFYVQRAPPARGGDSENNNCLYDCLREVIPMSKLPWKTPKDLKTFAGCEENAKIHFKQLGNIENRLNKPKIKPKYAINLSGDHLYSSENNDAKYKIYLNLHNGHYELANKSAHLKQKGILKKEKPIAIYEYNDQKNNIKVYTGKVFLGLSRENLKKYQKIPQLAPYLFIPNERGSKMKDTYVNFIKLADELKAKTDGKINLYKTGNLRRTALDLFYSFHKTLEVDEITQAEAFWIQKSTLGPIIFAEKYKGNGYLYDFKSAYSSIQIDKNMKFPIKQGTFSNIPNELFQQKIHKLNNEYLHYGIYKAEITATKDTYKKIFRFNKSDNYYTHLDIQQAIKYGFKVELLVDVNGEVNALTYLNDSLISGYEMFGDYVKLLYPLKEDHITGAKLLLNILWGALCKKNIVSDKIKNSDIIADSHPNEIREIVEIIPVSDTHTIFKFTTNECIYDTKFARIKPFILSKARAKIGNAIYPVIEHVYYSHTDSIISDIPLEDKMLGDKIGDLRYEGFCYDCHINNCKDKSKKEDFENEN